MIFLVVVYFMNGLPAEWYRFSLFSLVAITVCLVAEGLGLAIGSIFNVTVSMYIYSYTPQSYSKDIKNGLLAYLEKKSTGYMNLSTASGESLQNSNTESKQHISSSVPMWECP
jgi:hypothetical protein